MYSIYSLALLCFTTTTSMAFKPGIIPMKPVIKEVGVTLPFREKFDPLHLSDNVSDSEFARLRESELKHGRWAMISATTIPLIESFTHRPAIHEFDNLQPLQQLAILSLIMIAEFQTIVRGYRNCFKEGSPAAFKLKDDYQPGDLGLGMYQFMSKYDFIEKANKELNNGRLAMFGAIGMIVQELVTNKPLF